MNTAFDTSKRAAAHHSKVARGAAIAVTAVALAFAATGASAQGHGGGGHGGGGHGGGAFHGGGGFHGGGFHGGGFRSGPRFRGGWGWGAGVGLGVGIGFPAYYYGYPYPYYDDPGYVVVDPNVVYGTTQPVPQSGGPVPSQPYPAQQNAPVIYPRNGQSPQQMDADSNACSEWAGKQPNATSDSNVFHRAVDACMDARGYTLR
jgi:hypothetical protein